MSTLKILKMFTWFVRFAQAENCLTRSLKKNSLKKNTQQKCSDRLCSPSTTVMLKILLIEIWNLKTFFSKQRMKTQILKLLILAYQKFVILKTLERLKDLRLEQVLHITFLQKFWLETMINLVISGQLDVFFIFCCVDIHPSMVMMIKKF